MIDTIGYFVMLKKKDYLTLLTKTLLTQRIDVSTGDIEFEYNQLMFNQSWNYRVLFKIQEKKWEYDPALGKTQLVRCDPYLRFEFSVPKILSGHNLDSYSWDGAWVASQKVKDEFESLYGVKLPKIFNWFVYRVDTCANFVLRDQEQVKKYIHYLQRFQYPRKDRGKRIFEHSIYFASRHSTFKVYAKGVEFKVHDACRFLNEVERKKLQNKADKILRVEVEHKTRLKYIAEKQMQKKITSIGETFNGYMTLWKTTKYFKEIEEMERITNKFLCGCSTKIMGSLDVYKLLNLKLGKRSANFHYSVYMLLVTQGQNLTKEQVAERTYYKSLSVFRELGISIFASDLEKIDIELDRGFPSDFTLDMSKNNQYYQLPLAA